MKLDTFFEKFELFADAPNAVTKMRELVLQLAMQGDLVPQSEAEPSVPYDAAEDAVPINVTDVPANWRVVLLADAVKNRSGNSKLIKGKLFDAPAPNLFQGFSASGADVWCEDYEHEGEAIIISAVGARCGKAFKASGKWCAIANTNIARPDSALFNFDFAYLVLNDERFWVRGGSAQPFVKFPPSLDRHFALPPLAEQKRIVAKVDELMALCDRLEAQQQERQTRHAALARASLSRFADAPTPASLDFLFHPSYTIPPADLRKTILTLAVQGKLVPQDSNDEPAEEMLKKIEREKKRLSDSGELKADKKAWLNSSPNPPHDIPDSWSWVRLQDVFEISRGGSPRPAGDPRFFGGSIPWITVGEVTKDAGKYLTETATGLTEDGSERSRFINPGDLLLTNSGATLGVPKISKIRGCMNDGVAVLRLFHSFDFNEFGYLYLTHQTAAFRNVNQGMGQPNLNTPIIAGWFFPLPPLAEQRRIVAKVDQLMALVDQLEAQLAASVATAGKLMDAVVAELTAQA